MNPAKYIKKQIKAQLPTAIWDSINDLKFVLMKPLTRLEIPDTPHFDVASTTFFTDALKSSNNYIEYGSGGSTVLACQLGKPVISIDSDRRFLNAVERKLRGGLRNDQRLMPVDIGLTGMLGDTVFQTANPFAFEEVEKLPECTVANHVCRGSRSDSDRRSVSRMLCADHD